MTRSTRSRLAAFAVAGSLASSVLGQNLFTNPSFETGDFSGWTKTSTGGIVRAAAPTFAVRSGNFAIDNNSSGWGTTLTQTVAVQGGTTYEVGAWLAMNKPGGAPGTAVAGTTLLIGFESQSNHNVALTLRSQQQPAQYQLARTLLYVPAGQTTATIKYQLPTFSLSAYVVSADDFYMKPWTDGAPAPAAERIFAPGTPLPGGGTLSGGNFLSMANDGRVAAIDGSGATAKLVIRAADGSYSARALPGMKLNQTMISPTGETVLLRVGSPASIVEQILTVDAAGNVVEHARGGAGQPGGGSFYRILDARSDDAGRVVFSALSSSSASEGSIYRSTAGAGVTSVATIGSTNAQGTLENLSSFAQNNTGLVAFTAIVRPPGQTSRLAVLYVNDGVNNIVRASSGDVAPGEMFPSFAMPSMNDAGEIAFKGGVGTAAAGIGVNHGATTDLIALTDQPAPRGGTYTRDFGIPLIGSGGHVAFGAVTSDGSGLFRGRTGEAPVAIARAGDALPGGGTFPPYDFFVTSTPLQAKVLAKGQVVFLTPNDGGSGIYIGDGQETIVVAAWGQMLDGKSITSLELSPPAPTSASPSSLQPAVRANDFGQVAYTARFAEGGVGSYLYTPTLHWRSENSGNWSDTDNWTVGLAPAAVHPVVIDSPHSVTVTGPAADTTIASLKVGAGNALALAPGANLTVTQGVTIDPGGSLTGVGTITGDVTNSGTIAPGHSAGTITIAGDLTQTGALALELLDANTSDQLIVIGDLTLGGDVFVFGGAGVGDTFDLIHAASITGSPTWHLPGESTMQIVNLPGGGQSVQVTYVPEPGAFAVLALVAPFVSRRRRSTGSANSKGVRHDSKHPISPRRLCRRGLSCVQRARSEPVHQPELRDR
jgi:hypothetical protein